MANIVFMGTELELLDYTADNGSAAGNPDTNMENYIETSKWLSLDATAYQSVIIDTGSDQRSRNGIGIVNHNLYGIMNTGSIAVQEDTDIGFPSPTNLITSLGVGSNDPLLVKFPFATATERFIRLYFNGTLNWAPSIGNLFVDEVLDFGFPYDFPYYPTARTFETTMKEMLDGTLRTSQARPGRRTFRFGISASRGGFTTAVGTSWQTFYNRIQGRLRPFFFLDLDGTTAYYVHLNTDSDPMEVLRYNVAGIASFHLIEQVPK